MLILTCVELFVQTVTAHVAADTEDADCVPLSGHQPVKDGGSVGSGTDYLLGLRQTLNADSVRHHIPRDGRVPRDEE